MQESFTHHVFYYATIDLHPHIAKEITILSEQLLLGLLVSEAICTPDSSTIRQSHGHEERAKGGITASFEHS